MNDLRENKLCSRRYMSGAGEISRQISKSCISHRAQILIDHLATIARLLFIDNGIGKLPALEDSDVVGGGDGSYVEICWGCINGRRIGGEKGKCEKIWSVLGMHFGLRRLIVGKKNWITSLHLSTILPLYMYDNVKP